MGGRGRRDRGDGGDGARSLFYPDTGLCALTEEGKGLGQKQKGLFLQRIDEAQSTRSALGGSSDLLLLLHNVGKLLDVLGDSSPGTTISIFMRDIVNVGNNEAPESNLKVIGH